MDIIKMRDWGFGWQNLPRPLLIAGPCSAETEAQTLESCRGAAEAGAVMLRAGIWKPRTRPDQFEGIGEIGLPWLTAAGREFGLPVTVEIANGAHVEAALKAGVDVLWIGARTTVNPFSVQEIADALRGTNIPVMVKNPLNPDVGLWIGAFERLYKVGIQRMAAIHRGFSVANAAPYRNKPKWELPIELHRCIEGLDIINDPSHIAGKRDLLFDIAQKAMNLNFDGLMIETHCAPDAAWSDAAQQVTGADLRALLDKLVIRRASTDDPDLLNKLEELRDVIDTLDLEIISLLSKRMETSREIGGYKRAHQITILQIERWRQIFESRTAEAEKGGLHANFVKSYLEALHLESIRQQASPDPSEGGEA